MVFVISITVCVMAKATSRFPENSYQLEIVKKSGNNALRTKSDTSTETSTVQAVEKTAPRGTLTLYMYSWRDDANLRLQVLPELVLTVVWI